jgi:hypothetical protein
MKKIFFICFVLCSSMAMAQSPQVTVTGSDSSLVRMNKLLINVKIIGNLAYTTAEMHFINKSNRQREAELLFPLPEGVSVSRYAIDISGKMRDAVPVDKSKGKQVFEAIEHRRVDPGLLEKVEGNNFKTRIFPIMPNGAERIVIIGYEQELSAFDKSNLAYQLVSTYGKKLEKFEINIEVLGAAAPPVAVNGVDSSATNIAWTNSNHTSIKKTDYQPSEKLLIKIPVREDIPGVVVQGVNDQHYFYVNTFVEGKKNPKAAPASIGLIWDNSLSCKSRNLQKELALLDAYFKKIGSTKVTLYQEGYYFVKDQVYTISNGNWDALKTKLEKTIYDGGTRFSQINPGVHDEYLFFTDGLSSLSSNNLPKTTKPFYTVTSSVSADFSYLNYTATKSQANFINLNELNTAQALDKLAYNTLRFLGIKENNLITEIYPAAGTPVSGSFSIAGISLKARNEVTLLFGYGDKATIERKATINDDGALNEDVNIEKIWAQKKIADLNLNYAKNEEEIEMTGKRYGIITQNTSLIVLENINDYIAYEIVPPTELRAEYDRILKQQQATMAAEQRSNWKNVDAYFNELKTWWTKNTKYTKPIAVQKPAKKKAPVPETVSVINSSNASVGYSANATAPATAADKAFYSTSSANLEDVVVTAAGTKRDLKSMGNSSAVTQYQFAAPLQGKIPGLQVTTVNERKEGEINIPIYDSIGVESSQTVQWGTTTSTWNPDRIYLKAIAAAPAEKKYEVYLQLREEQQNNPSFYFDVAAYFYNKGDKQKAMMILSCIADLGLENHQLYKTLTYNLRQWGEYEDALFTAQHLVKWRGHEPQSHRDLALALEDNKQYQAAFDELIKALETNYYGEMSGQYEGVEDIILMDMNRIMTERNSIKTGKLNKKYLMQMPVEVRIVMDWNQMDTDLDLHVTEPTGEECYYGHKSTVAGARFSKDFTQGYGPEQYLIRNAVKGKYIIKTNYFGESTLTENGPATVLVEIYTKRANGKTERKLQTVQLGKIKEDQPLAVVTID